MKKEIILLVLIIALLLIELYPESPYRSEYVVTSEWHSTIGYGGERRNNLHEGIDLWCADPIIFAIAPGIVKEIGINEIYGKYVIIEHNDNGDIYFSLYAHGSTIYYSALPGSKVDNRTAIMKQGSTGYSSGDHLHLSIFRVVDGERVFEDPGEYLEEGEV